MGKNQRQINQCNPPITNVIKADGLLSMSPALLAVGDKYIQKRCFRVYANSKISDQSAKPQSGKDLAIH